MVKEWEEQLEVSFQEQLRKLEFKPFGGYNYSYSNTFDRNASFIIWTFVTAGSYAVDWREASIVLGLSLWAQETIKKKEYSSGASWVHNVQAGYCLYHYWAKNNKKMLVFLGVLAEAAATSAARTA